MLQWLRDTSDAHLVYIVLAQELLLHVFITLVMPNKELLDELRVRPRSWMTPPWGMYVPGVPRPLNTKLGTCMKSGILFHIDVLASHVGVQCWSKSLHTSCYSPHDAHIAFIQSLTIDKIDRLCLFCMQ
jgi:hypothetical protein